MHLRGLWAASFLTSAPSVGACGHPTAALPSSLDRTEVRTALEVQSAALTVPGGTALGWEERAPWQKAGPQSASPIPDWGQPLTPDLSDAFRARGIYMSPAPGTERPLRVPHSPQYLSFLPSRGERALCIPEMPKGNWQTMEGSLG